MHLVVGTDHPIERDVSIADGKGSIREADTSARVEWISCLAARATLVHLCCLQGCGHTPWVCHTLCYTPVPYPVPRPVPWYGTSMVCVRSRLLARGHVYVYVYFIVSEVSSLCFSVWTKPSLSKSRFYVFQVSVGNVTP